MADLNILLLSHDPVATQSNPDLHNIPVRLKQRDLPNVRRLRMNNRPTLAQQLRSNYINAKFNTAEAQILRKKSKENVRKKSSGSINTKRKPSEESTGRRSAKSDTRVRKNSNVNKSGKSTTRQASKSASNSERDAKTPNETEDQSDEPQGYLTYRGHPRMGYNTLHQKENTLPADFVLDGNGMTGVQWSRYNSPKKTPKSMSTKTTIETKTYQKNGKWYEDEIKTVTMTEGGTTKTTTTTTTKEVDPFDDFSSDNQSNEPTPKTSPVKTPQIKSPDRKGLLSRLTDSRGGSEPENDDDNSKFATYILELTNEKRRQHGVKDLKLSKELTEYSKQWAERIAKNDQMEHNPAKKYGENIYCVSSSSRDFKVDADKVVDSWYKEIKYHDFTKEPEGGVLQSGHFSQLVWKDTKEMGVYKARSKNGLKIYVVANYSPKGNWIGEFTSQVLPVGGLPKSASTRTKASSPEISSKDSSGDEDDFEEDILRAHNEYRAKHGVQALKYDKKLGKFAQEWANTIAKKERMEHRPNNKYGENIFMKWSSNPNHKVKGSEAVDSWYSEIKFFTFGQEPTGLEAGHFTQVVWAKSERLGVGVGRSKSGKIYVVANYDPPGNFVGSFAANVPPFK